MPSPINRQVTSFDQYSRSDPANDMTPPQTRFGNQYEQMRQDAVRNQANDKLQWGNTYNANGTIFPQGKPDLNPGEPTSKGANGRNTYGDSGADLDNTRKVLGQGYNPSYLNPLSNNSSANTSNNIGWWGQQQPGGGPANPQDDKWSIMNQAKMAKGEINNPVLEAAGLQKPRGQSGQSGQPDLLNSLRPAAAAMAASGGGAIELSKEQIQQLRNGQAGTQTLGTTNYNEPNPQSFGSWYNGYQQRQQTPNYGDPGGSLRNRASAEEQQANLAKGYGVNSNSNSNVRYDNSTSIKRPQPERIASDTLAGDLYSKNDAAFGW